MQISSKIKVCAVCGTSCLEELWDLPKLPFTEKYGVYDPLKNLPVDQTLLFCTSCGHMQLSNQISPKFLYAPSEYAFRTSESHSAQIGSLLFFDFFQKVAQGKKFEVFLDIGGNDLFLAKKLNGKVAKRFVVDPVCKDLDGKEVDGIHVIGKPIEETFLPLKVDLVFCRHVLEHLAQPREVFKKILSECKEDTLFVFEVPCMEHLVESNRWDAIFHQHYHYFNIYSFQRLIFDVGGEYITHCFNEQGSCGGSLLIAFRKGRKRNYLTPQKFQAKEKLENYLKSIKSYRSFMNLFSKKLKTFDKNIYGYGASLMLATFAYHLNTDLSELICVLDDDREKHGLGYQNLPVKICHPDKESLPLGSNFLITSLENTRKIYQKISTLSPRRILTPYIS